MVYDIVQPEIDTEGGSSSSSGLCAMNIAEEDGVFMSKVVLFDPNEDENLLLEKDTRTHQENVVQMFRANQKWHWDVSINETVRTEFNKTAKFRLVNTVSDWKDKWRVVGDAGKPVYLSVAVWDGLKKYWTDGHNATVAEKCSTSRNAKLPDGTPKQMAHTSGQIPFAGRAHEMAKELGHKPAVSAFFEKTHRKKTGEFVDSHSERIFNDLEARKTEIETQRSQRSSGGTQYPGEPLTTAELDQIYHEVAPKKKGRVLGMGSMQDVPLAPTNYRSPAELQAEIQNMHATQVKNMQFYNSLFTVLSASNPELLRTMQTHPDRSSTEQAGTSNVDPENATQDYFGPNFNLDD